MLRRTNGASGSVKVRSRRAPSKVKVARKITYFICVSLRIAVCYSTIGRKGAQVIWRICFLKQLKVCYSQ